MDLICICGETFRPGIRHLYIPDMHESVAVPVMECSCGLETFTPEQTRESEALIAAAKGLEESRDFNQEAIDNIASHRARGMLIPAEFAYGTPIEIESDIHHHKFNHVFVSVTDKGTIKLSLEDSFDGMYVTLDNKQEAELLGLLLLRADPAADM